VTVDPPRSGLDAKAIEAVVRLEPERIVYVSCDPATLARDVKILAERGYKADRLGITDMFPRTKHMECVVRMKKHKNFSKNA
jgi:23S rRNA (uracil1939-C5)-methyltransferase